MIGRAFPRGRYGMISQKAKYALRALVALARSRSGATMMIGEISREQAIPKKFLEQILLELKRAGIVMSLRGRSGGYALLKAPEEVTFGEVLRLIDGPVAPLPCLSKIAYRRCEDCQDEASCEVRHVFERVALATRAVLDSTTLADALKLEDMPI
jgi:Rrf2 family protein